jgi:hypothetical protein
MGGIQAQGGKEKRPEKAVKGIGVSEANGTQGVSMIGFGEGSEPSTVLFPFELPVLEGYLEGGFNGSGTVV